MCTCHNLLRRFFNAQAQFQLKSGLGWHRALVSYFLAPQPHTADIIYIQNIKYEYV